MFLRICAGNCWQRMRHAFRFSACARNVTVSDIATAEQRAVVSACVKIAPPSINSTTKLLQRNMVASTVTMYAY